MIFIDGGYLRERIRDIFGHEKIKFNALALWLTGIFSRYSIRCELITVYYYDALVNPTEDLDRYNEQDRYFGEIRTHDFYDVKLGRLIKTESGYRQKGVDVLLAIDMLGKAYEDQYDIGILLSGDDDLVDVVRAVKDVGKRVYGVYFAGHASRKLIQSFDACLELDAKKAKAFI